VSVFLTPTTSGDDDGSRFCASLPSSPHFSTACPEKTYEFPENPVFFNLSDNQDETCLIITINDTSPGYLPLIINISDTCKNQSKRFDFDNTINLSILIVIPERDSQIRMTDTFKERMRTPITLSVSS
jgi:hypothetical protein